MDIENVTASGFESDPSDYHPPGDAIDGDLTTWWSHNGNDPWIEISLVEPNPVCGVAVTWNKGDERDYSFEIGISEDGNNFEKVFEVPMIMSRRNKRFIHLTKKLTQSTLNLQ